MTSNLFNRGGGQKGGSGARSNWYSSSKFTNWTSFDPYWSEAKAFRANRPAVQVERTEGKKSLPVLISDTHTQFISPVTQNDVKCILEKVPQDFLSRLKSVSILSGTSKQIKALKLFRYGCYSWEKVFLHAFPKVLMTQSFPKPLSPAKAQEFESAGATISQASGGYIVHFDQASLRRFYLFDVLLHEIGHHVDNQVFSRPITDAERFAEWFAGNEARRIKNEL